MLFRSRFRPAGGISRFLCGTPPVLSLAALEVAVDLLLSCDLAEVRRKSVRMTDLLIELVEARCPAHPLGLVSPRRSATRGSQVSFRHPDGYAVMQALIARGVIGDFRAPDILRFGVNALYTSHQDVLTAATLLHRTTTTGTYDPAPPDAGTVT